MFENEYFVIVVSSSLRDAEAAGAYFVPPDQCKAFGKRLCVSSLSQLLLSLLSWEHCATIEDVRIRDYLLRMEGTNTC